MTIAYIIIMIMIISAAYVWDIEREEKKLTRHFQDRYIRDVLPAKRLALPIEKVAAYHNLDRVYIYSDQVGYCSSHRHYKTNYENLYLTSENSFDEVQLVAVTRRGISYADLSPDAYTDKKLFDKECLELLNRKI